MAMLGIAGEAGASPDDGGGTWGGLSVRLVSELVANQHFNRLANIPYLVSWAETTWRRGWPPTVAAKTAALAGGSPAELFEEATKVSLDDFMSVCVHLWTQAQLHGHVRFPQSFFDRLGLDRAAVDLFLGAASADLVTLRSAVASERARVGSAKWAFNALRRYPIVKLASNEFLVLRIGFVIERALGVATYFDVESYLKGIDPRRADAFRAALRSSFEADVGATLKRMFNSGTLARRVFDEAAMRSAWGRKGSAPKTCDFVVDCGKTWLMVEVTERRLPESAVNGSLVAVELDRELDLVLTQRKSEQLDSTARLLRRGMAKLCGRAPTPGTRFVPIVITPNEGLGWNEVVHRRAIERSQEMGMLGGSGVLPLCLMSHRDLRALEALVETDTDAGHFLAQWREDAPGLPFDHYVIDAGKMLRHPAWEMRTFEGVIDELVARMVSAD
ncbi:hypothetical protein ABZS29_22165 [Kribbella sp. NPDC005582]|uniref:hypothetical protein n=1 Tax=Kribbella sp. NPDC005582 TaxID=3156893 RepID=UPI00339FF1A2